MMRFKFSMGVEAGAAICALALGAVFTFGAFWRTDAEVYLFPRIIAAALLVLAALQCVVARHRSAAAVASAWRGLWPGLVAVLAYVALLEFVGFYAASLSVFLCIVLIYGKRRALDVKALCFKFCVGAAFMTLLYVLFWRLLYVRTPVGLLL